MPLLAINCLGLIVNDARWGQTEPGDITTNRPNLKLQILEDHSNELQMTALTDTKCKPHVKTKTTWLVLIK